MGNASPNRKEGSSLVTGFKTAALIVILGAIAAVADQAFFLSPHESAQHASNAVPAAAAPSSGAFAVPENLRTNAGEVPEHVSAF